MSISITFYLYMTLSAKNNISLLELYKNAYGIGIHSVHDK
jgi:hypothetical protein